MNPFEKFWDDGESDERLNKPLTKEERKRLKEANHRLREEIKRVVPLLEPRIKKETINYDEFCDFCKRCYENQHSGEFVYDFQIICMHDIKDKP